MMMSQRCGVAARAASVLLVATLLLAPGPLGGGTTNANCHANSRGVLLVEARRGKVAKQPPQTPTDPRSGHHAGGAVNPSVVGLAIGAGQQGGAVDSTGTFTSDLTSLPANFTDRLAHRLAELEREKEEERAKKPSPWGRITKIFKGKERKPCQPPGPKVEHYRSNATDGDEEGKDAAAAAAQGSGEDDPDGGPEITLDDMEAEEAAFLDCKGGTGGGNWAATAISSITKSKPAQKIISWWGARGGSSGDDYDDGKTNSADADEVAGLGIGGDEKNMTAEELDLVYAAEKERYRSTENHPLLKAAEITYEYVHMPPSSPPSPPQPPTPLQKLAISLEDEEIITSVMKNSRDRNATDLILEETALRLAAAREARARRAAGGGRSVDKNKMIIIGVFLVGFGLFVYRARYGFGAGVQSAAVQIARMDPLSGIRAARVPQWGFNNASGSEGKNAYNGGSSGGGGSGGGVRGPGRFAQGAPVFKPQFPQHSQAGRMGTWSQNNGGKFKSALE